MPISEIVPEYAIDKIVDEIIRVVRIVEKHLAQTRPHSKL